MKIFVKAKPGFKEDKVEKIDETHYVVAVKELPIQGRANRAIINILAEFFKISPSRINIVSGYTTKQKIIEIL